MASLNGIDLNLLRALDVLIEESNVTRAADRLGISQPGLSAQLSRLRALFGDPLLVPAENGRGMVATQRARELQAPLRASLQDLAALVRTPPHFDPRVDARSFAIGTADNAAVTLGIGLVEHLRKHAGSGVRVAFRRSGPDAASRLEHGDIDLLIASDRALPEAMKARKLLDENYLVVQRRHHPRGRGPLDLDAYCALEHVLVSTSGGSFHGYLDEQLEALGRRRRVAVSVHQFMMAPAIVEATDLVSTLPARFARRHADRLDLFELPLAVQGFNLYAVWHPRAHGDPALRWLREQLATLAGQGDRPGPRTR
ncbi:MAG: LysR family transcriptional regulator [Burkholderiaceae bacterium]